MFFFCSQLFSILHLRQRQAFATGYNSNFVFQDKNLVLSNELIKVELPL